MPTTPLLAITQVSTSQNSKEVTINDAIIALEDATNRAKVISFAGGATYNLSATEATRNFIFRAQAASAPITLNFPVAVNGSPYNRIFAVRNESGQGLTVKFATGAGSTVVVPNGQSRLIGAFGGEDMVVAAEPQSAVNFVSLSDAPSTLTGEQGKFLSVNAEGDSLVFIDAAVFPSLATNNNKVLTVKTDGTGVEWRPLNTITNFLALTDSPDSYAGSNGKLVAVKSDATGVEFIDPPESEAVEFVAAAQWRIRVTQAGIEPRIGFGEIEFQDQNGIDQTSGGVAFASNFEAGREPALAFDGSLAAGTGWRTEAAYAGEVTIGYTFTTPKTIRTVKLYPITGAPDFAPARFFIEYYNGTTWVDAGERVASSWVEATAQSFKVNGFPLQSVPDAPADGNYYARRNEAWENVAEHIRDVLGLTLVQGSNITITVDDVANTVTIAATAADPESIRDAIGAAMLDGTGLDFVYNDALDTMVYNLDPATLPEIITGTNTGKAITPKGLYDSAAPVVVVDAATITLNGNAGINFSLALAGSRTLGNPINMKPGQSGIITITQDATGGRVLTYDTGWKFAGGAASGVLSTAANAVDVLSYYVRTNGDVIASLAKDFKS